MIPDGYTDLGPGKIASVVTYLDMLKRPAPPTASIEPAAFAAGGISRA